MTTAQRPVVRASRGLRGGGHWLPLMALVVGACSEKAPPPEESVGDLTHGLSRVEAQQVLAQVGDTSITLGQFAERLAHKSPYLQARYNSVERRREFLDSMVRFELLASEAVRKGYDKTDEVERLRKQVMVQQLMKELFEDGVKQSEITEQEIKAYYDANPDEFRKPAQVRISHILVKSKSLAERLLRQLKANPGDHELFRKLAKEHSQDPVSRPTLGDLPFLSRPEHRQPDEASAPEALITAGFALQSIGELHPEVVASEQGFHVVKLIARRDAMHRSLDETRRVIQNRLWRERREQKIEQFVATLRQRANVQENLSLLDQVEVDAEAPAESLSTKAVPPAPSAPRAAANP